MTEAVFALWFYFVGKGFDPIAVSEALAQFFL